MSKNKISKIQDGEFSVVSARGANALLRRLDTNEWVMLLVDSDSVETHTELYVFESFKVARTKLAAAFVEEFIPVVTRTEQPEIKVWLHKTVTDVMGLAQLSEEEQQKSGIKAVRMTKAWAHITFNGPAGVLELANALEAFESSERRTEVALKKAVKTLRAAAL